MPIALCGLFAFFAMFFFFPMDAEAQGGQATYDLRAAVRTVVEGRGLPYAGICEEINQSANAGKYCATIREENQFQATISVGLVGGTQPYTITFQNGIAGWTLATHNLPVPVTDDLRVAIQKLVESRGFAYSGLCNEFVPPRDNTTFCGTITASDANTAQVKVGTLTGPQYSAYFVRHNGAWSVNSHSLPVNVGGDVKAIVRSVIEGRLHLYAGLCNEINANNFPGYWCATLQSLTNDYAQFAAGPIGSSTTYQVALVKKNGGWTVHSHTVPFNIPSELRQQLRTLVEGRGFQFAGLCNEIETIRYPGYLCAHLETISANGAQFTVTHIGTSNTYSATFIRKNGAWQVSSHNLPFNPSAELRLALARFVESRGYDHAGLCKEIDQSRNVGRWCATPMVFNGDSARFTVGPVRSSDVYSVTFIRKSGAWTASGDDVPFNVPNSVRALLRSFIEGRGYAYAGLCPEIDMAKHIGKWCAYPMQMSLDKAEFAVGPIYSSSPYKVTFTKRSGSWAVSSQNVPANVPDGLRAAIRNLVEMRGFRYAGLCIEIDQPNNVGKWCANVTGVPGTSAQVTIGPVLSDSFYNASFATQNGSWTAASHKLPLNLPADLRANIKSLIESRGLAFAGLCEQIDQASNLGKACAFVRWESDVRAVVTYGRVATDELHRAVFEHRAGAWMMTSGDTSPVVTPTPTPTPTKPPVNNPTPRPSNPTPTPQPETPEPVDPTPSPEPETPEPVDPTPSPEPEQPIMVIPQALREAIARFILDSGEEYLGICAEIHVMEGATGSCAIVDFISDTEARVLYGPVFGGTMRTVVFLEYAGEWLATTAPTPDDEDNDPSVGMASFLLLGLAGIGVTGLGAGIYAARRK